MSTDAPAVASPQSLQGVWRSDPIHSTVGFAVRHMVVSTFRGRVPRFEATLTADDAGLRLEGTAPVAALEFADPNLHEHIMSPDFLDLERHPELRFVSTAVEVDAEGAVVAEGELTVRGVARPLVLRGTLEGPIHDPYGSGRIGLTLEGTFDRRDFGLTWQLPLPDGGLALGHEVQLNGQLELVHES
jgi:polyisoprenoid-binding protein YceI